MPCPLLRLLWRTSGVRVQSARQQAPSSHQQGVQRRRRVPKPSQMALARMLPWGVGALWRCWACSGHHRR